MKKIICPYCNKPAKWVENSEIYGRNYGRSYMMWYCRKDNAYVGCHNNTKRPLGTMANRELREWRKKAHSHIDPIWQSGELARAQVYARLTKAFGKQIHVGESDIETCKRILEVEISQKALNQP